MQIKDLLMNIKIAYYGLSLECRNPFEKKEIEELLERHNLRWTKGYIEQNKAYVFLIVGGGKKKMLECLSHFIKMHECKYHYSKSVFKTKITCFVWMD